MFTGNDIIKVTPDSWRGLGNTLQSLLLAENSITNLPTDLFAGLNEVDTIDLTGNNLKEIDPSVFRDGMEKLANLLLAHNQLGAIPYQAISPLKTLKDLDLSYNKITSMNPATEVGVQTVNYNFVLNLDELRLDYNQITLLPPGSFQLFNVVNKTYLDGNQLKFIGVSIMTSFFEPLFGILLTTEIFIEVFKYQRSNVTNSITGQCFSSS